MKRTVDSCVSGSGGKLLFPFWQLIENEKEQGAHIGLLIE